MPDFNEMIDSDQVVRNKKISSGDIYKSLMKNVNLSDNIK